MVPLADLVKARGVGKTATRGGRGKAAVLSARRSQTPSRHAALSDPPAYMLVARQDHGTTLLTTTPHESSA